jgi:nicotinate-nucleotide adenylyltransferase
MIPRENIGLFGGSFDPVHHGHLILAREAMERLGLNRVVFIPANVSPHKLGRPPAPAGLRLEMLEAAVAGEAGFAVDACELGREGPSFAIDTVREFRGRFPEAGIFYFIGEDNLAALHTWKDIGELRALAQFVVLARGAVGDPQGLPVVSRNVDISSTDIRKRVADGRSVRYLLPHSSMEIIERHRLYRNG